MKPRSCKAKGRNFVKELVDEICGKLKIDQNDVQITGSGQNGEDIKLASAAQRRFPFCVEAKNVQTLNIWSAIRQAHSHALGRKRMPLVIFRRNRSETYACLHLGDLLKLIDRCLEHGEFQGFED